MKTEFGQAQSNWFFFKEAAAYKRVARRSAHARQE